LLPERGNETYDLTIKVLDPITGPGRERVQKKSFESIVCTSVVEHTTHNLKIKGSKPANISGRERMQGKKF
jgi:hypothetical protein